MYFYINICGHFIYICIIHMCVYIYSYIYILSFQFRGNFLSTCKWTINYAQINNKLLLSEGRQKKTWKSLKIPAMCLIVQ